MTKINRRRLLAGAGAALVLPSLLERTFGSLALAAQPAPPDQLVVAQGAEPATLHPLLETGLVEASAYGNIYDPLVTLDAEGRLVPALAESWEQRDDRSWIFRLRPGVTFHNGEVFDSASVRFTIGTLLDPANSSPIRTQLDAIERVETPDAQTVVIVTRQPFAPLLAELTQLMMIPRLHTERVGFEALADQPNGTGPFRFVEHRRGERIVLAANDRPWGDDVLTQRLELRRVPDTFTRMATVQTGESDLATNVPIEQVSTLQGAGTRVVGRPGVQSLYLRLHARKPPLDDIRVRRAISCAIDVDLIVSSMYGGRARRITGPYPPEVFGYDPAASLPIYDPDLARSLLREAGVVEGTPLTFETPQGRYPKDDEVAQAIAGFLESVGFRVQLRVIEWGAYLRKLQAGEGEHLFLLAGTNRTFDPHFTIVRLYGGGSVFGRAYYGNPDIDPLAAQAAAEMDSERRLALYGRILATLRSDVPALWLAQLDDLYAVSPSVDWEPRADSLVWLRS
jgi:peptide/nickel transport system substrate-binding protein